MTCTGVPAGTGTVTVQVKVRWVCREANSSNLAWSCGTWNFPFTANNGGVQPPCAHNVMLRNVMYGGNDKALVYKKDANGTAAAASSAAPSANAAGVVPSTSAPSTPMGSLNCRTS